MTVTYVLLGKYAQLHTHLYISIWPTLFISREQWWLSRADDENYNCVPYWLFIYSAAISPKI
jgi:hypothetical protein